MLCSLSLPLKHRVNIALLKAFVQQNQDLSVSFLIEYLQPQIQTRRIAASVPLKTLNILAAGYTFVRAVASGSVVLEYYALEASEKITTGDVTPQNCACRRGGPAEIVDIGANTVDNDISGSVVSAPSAYENSLPESV